MNVLLAADYAPVAAGSVGASFVELGRFLQSRGDCLVCVFPKNQYTARSDSWIHWLEDNGITVHLLDRETDKDEVKFLQHLTQKHQIDVLHLHFGLFVKTVMHHRELFPQKVLIHNHMCFPHFNQQPQKDKLRCMVQSLQYRRKRMAIASVGKEQDKAYRLARHWYVPNGYTHRRSFENYRIGDDVRREFNISDNKKVIFMLGWSGYIKGVDVAFKALEMLHKEDPDVVLAFVGIGTPPNKDRIRFIEEKAGVDPFSDWIIHLPSTDDIFAYHQMCDAFLSASRAEGFSFGVLEAISQNTPVVLSDIADTRWAWEYSNHHCYHTESVEDCARALKEALVVGRTDSNYRDIIEKYSIENWCKRLSEIYHSL